VRTMDRERQPRVSSKEWDGSGGSKGDGVSVRRGGIWNGGVVVRWEVGREKCWSCERCIFSKLIKLKDLSTYMCL